jgi:hypothetical protein
MVCRSCRAENVTEFGAEINIHSPAQEGLDEPPVLVFPKLVVCLGCGFTDFTLEATELRRVAEVSAKRSSADSLRLKVSMVAKYDIFKKTNDSVIWVEAVEDIVAVQKRLISLGSAGEYRVWDSTEQRFVDVLHDCA